MEKYFLLVKFRLIIRFVLVTTSENIRNILKHPKPIKKTTIGKKKSKQFCKYNKPFLKSRTSSCDKFVHLPGLKFPR